MAEFPPHRPPRVEVKSSQVSRQSLLSLSFFKNKNSCKVIVTEEPSFICSPVMCSWEMENIDEKENEARMLRGELYHAFMPKLTAKRNRCHHAVHRFNSAGEAPRRKLVELWRE
jgi:hypothetical protein